MKPATKKMDAQIWKLWNFGMLPKDIMTSIAIHSLRTVYNALHRERRRREIPLRRGIGRPKKDKKG